MHTSETQVVKDVHLAHTSQQHVHNPNWSLLEFVDIYGSENKECVDTFNSTWEGSH